MNYRTFVKTLLLAFLLLPSLASADDSTPADDSMPDVADIHVGVTDIELGGDAAATSGVGIFADAEAGWRVGHFDFTGFGAYATRNISGNYDNGFGDIEKLDYRVHLVDLGLRATLRWTHVYGGLGVAFENEIESGTSKAPTGTLQQISNNDAHVAGELRLGAIVQHVDVSASMTVGSAYGDPLASFRFGVGYRF